MDRLEAATSPYHKRVYERVPELSLYRQLLLDFDWKILQVI